MQFKLYTIPVGDNVKALEEMNSFLRSNKILEVQKQLVNSEYGAYWCFCVHYIENSISQNRVKVDYKQVLDEDEFKKFSKMREIRKKISIDDGIPAFAIFTDEDLASMSKFEELTEKNMMSIKGIGEKKVERFSKYFIGSTKL